MNAELRNLPVADEATDARQRTALRRRAKYLQRINHTNVAQVDALEEFDDKTILRYQTFPAQTIVEAAKIMSTAQLSRLFANACATLNELHLSGVVHGALTPHILLCTPSGRVVFHGFSDPQDRDLHMNPDDDICALLEIARLCLATKHDAKTTATAQRPTARRRYVPLKRSPNREPMEIALKKLLLNKELPTASQLVSFFTKWANRLSDTPKPIPGKHVKRPSEKSPFRNCRMSTVIVAGLGICLFVLTGFSHHNKQTMAKSTAKSTIPASIATVTIDNAKYSAGESNVIVISGDFYCDGNTEALLLRPKEGTLWEFDSPQNAPTTTGNLITDGLHAAGLKKINAGSCDDAQLINANGQESPVQL